MLVLPERSLEISNPPDCLRQLIFESDWEEFPYWMMGTGFLALWNNSIFLITAAHCIAENQHDALRIPIRPRDAQLLPFDKFMTFETPGDARDLDVAMYRAKPPTEQDLFDVRNAAAPISPIPLAHTLIRLGSRPGTGGERERGGTRHYGLTRIGRQAG